MIATGLFVMSWAATYFGTPFAVGLLPEIVFPAAIGLYTFAVIRYSPVLTGVVSQAFPVREQIHIRLRLAATMVLPITLSVLLASVSAVRPIRPDLSSHLVVLFSLVAGYVLLAPVAQTKPGADALRSRAGYRLSGALEESHA
jgi:hypothetical protein